MRRIVSSFSSYKQLNNEENESKETENEYKRNAQNLNVKRQQLAQVRSNIRQSISLLAKAFKIRVNYNIMRNLLRKMSDSQATKDKRKLSKSKLVYTDYLSSINSTAVDHEVCHVGGLCTLVDVHNDSKSHKNINNRNKSRDSHLLHEFNGEELNHAIILATLYNNTMFGHSIKCCYLRGLNTDQVLIAKVSDINQPITGIFRRSVQSHKIQHEKKYWDKVSMHPNFYPLLGIVELENRSCFLTDNIPCTSLKSLISESGSLQESDICMIGAQIVLAVSHLHENGIVHRCISPDVISLDWRGRVRITDLSSCEQRGCTFEMEAIQRVKYPFIAPEILRGQCYEPCSDWWLVGCCLYQMLTGKSLISQHNSIQSLFKNISKECCKEAIEDIIRTPIEYPKELSKDAFTILSGFLEKDSNKRLKWNQETGIKSIKEHPFFTSIDWEKLASDESLGTIQMDLSYCIWSSEQTKIQQLLGPDYGGKYADCHIISHNKTNEEGVMKVVWKAKMRKTQSGWKNVMNERLVWQKVSGHPYTISLKGFFETEAAYCFVTQHISDAVSMSVVIKSAPLPEEVVKFLSGQLVVALNYLHQKGILHRSLSADSILVEKCGRLRLCDFESAKVAEFSCRPFGDCTYMAPEIFQGKEYGKEADWWAFAIILFEMILGNTPLDIYCDNRKITEDSDINTETLLRVVESIPKLIANMSSMPARKFLRELLIAIPEHRLGFKRNAYNEIKCHLFYKGLMWRKLESPDFQ